MRFALRVNDLLEEDPFTSDHIVLDFLIATPAVLSTRGCRLGNNTLSWNPKESSLVAPPRGKPFQYQTLSA